MKLKYVLQRWGDRILFKVIYMDERFRATTVADHEVVQKCFLSDKSGWSIVSNKCPHLDIDEKRVYLWGLWGHRDVEEGRFGSDSKECTYGADSIEEADRLIKQIHTAIEDWSENWDGWKDEPPAVEAQYLKLYVV